MYLKVLYFLVIISLISCKESNQNNTSKFNRHNFIETDSLNGLVYHIGTNVARPLKIVALIDYLVLSEKDSDSLLYIIEKASGNVIKKGAHGFGPNEITYPWFLYRGKKNNDFWVFQINTRYIDYFDLIHPENNFRVPLRKLNSLIQYAVPLHENGFVSRLTNGEYRYILFDKDGQKIAEYGIWSELGFYNNIPNSSYSSLFQGNFSYSGDSLLVHASINLDFIEIVNIYSQKIIKVQGPESRIPEVFIDYSPGYPMPDIKNDEEYYEYIKVEFVDDEIYALYSGKPSEKINEKGEEFGNEIFVFDLKGNPMKHYYLDKDISSFSVDPESGIIFGLRIMHTDSLIFRFDKN